MDPTIAKELAALREEIDALRAAVPQDNAPPDEEPAARSEPIRDIFARIQKVLAGTEAGIVAHPIAGAVAALLAGLLIGRVSKSR